MQNTPMSRIKDSMKLLVKLTDEAFQHYTLQKREPKYNPHGGRYGFGGESDGVSEDFIYIFKARRNWNDKSEHVPSFAVIVDYMGRELDECQFTITKQMILKNRSDKFKWDGARTDKNNKEIEYGVSFGLEDFKKELRELNRKLKAVFEGENIDSATKEIAILKIIDDLYFDNPELKINEDEIQEDLKKVIRASVRDQDRLNNEIDEMQQDIQSREAKVRNSVSRSKPNKELADLIAQRDEIDQRIKEAKKNVSTRRDELTKKHEIPELKRAVREKQEALEEAVRAEEKARVKFFLDNKVTKTLQKKIDRKLGR